MFLGRDKKTEEKYQREKKELKLCPFCSPQENQNKVKKEYKHFLKFKNKYPYKNTKIHDLIAPKKHFISFEEMLSEKKALREFLDILVEEEKKGVTFVYRTKKSKEKSVEHLHIHLLKW